tara:strand:- start:378 stop:1127 length:750 start_codon:yes stop_codon:yes gene_type:complete
MSEEVKNNAENTKDVEVVEETQSPWYYFYSVGCGFCKKVEPIVDELNKNGHDILKLDVSDPENQKISQELKKEYKAQCGTPWFINIETGKQVCGYREKDVLEKWLNGEDIPAPPRPKGPMPKVPLLGVDGKEEAKWKKDYKKWAEENSHLPNLQSADQILSRPRPKTEPPKPPMPNSTDEQLDEWGKEYDKWASENKHLPNLQPSKVILDRMKNARNQQMNPPVGGNLEQRIGVLEQKLDRLMNHLGVK